MIRSKNLVRGPSALIALAFAFTFASTAAAAVLHQGTWTKKSFAIAGSWQIVEENGTRYVVLDDAFKTKKAPDLKLFLSPHPLADATGKNATDGAVLIAPLESPKGAQRYPIPAGVDLTAHNTLLLHCEKYRKLWGGGSL